MDEEIRQARPMMVVGGRRGGRRAALEAVIRARAYSPAEAELCIADLHKHGVALQGRDGRRVEPPPQLEHASATAGSLGAHDGLR